MPSSNKLPHIIRGIFDKRQHNRQYMRTIWRYLPGKTLKDWSPDMAIHFKHPFLVQHFMQMTQEIQEYITKMKPKMYTSKAADIAAESGNLVVLQELRKLGISCTSAGVHNAANNGHLCILKDIYEHENANKRSGTGVPLLSSCDPDAVIYYGHLDVLQFLLEDLEMECSNNSMSYAVKEGYLHIVKYLYEQGYTYEHRQHHLYEYSRGLHIDDVVYLAVEYGHLHIVEYLYEEYGYKFKDKHIKLATEYGYLHIVEYLQNKCGI